MVKKAECRVGARVKIDNIAYLARSTTLIDYGVLADPPLIQKGSYYFANIITDRGSYRQIALNRVQLIKEEPC